MPSREKSRSRHQTKEENQKRKRTTEKDTWEKMIGDSAKIRENTSYANALKGDQKMAPPPEQTSSKLKETLSGKTDKPETAAKEGSFGFMDAVMELKKFFTDYPSLLELGKKLRQAQGDERLFVFYHHLANN
ncbi:hypothetical protein TNIN_484461 [Trichonephila inaurata madagascariensis]|uniref:Uncharacterized protein n=1 Tax=Trichonephila inaurata madagascariensis TaxID=2747483 RepID=A0A8X6XVB8_9ARAC|nr:hypothetical protein TNIN_484461 [Trichonephila inaurata madagascariensis]